MSERQHGAVKPGPACMCGFSPGRGSMGKRLLGEHFKEAGRAARKRPAVSGFGVGRDIEIQDVPLHKMGR